MSPLPRRPAAAAVAGAVACVLGACSGALASDAPPAATSATTLRAPSPSTAPDPTPATGDQEGTMPTDPDPEPEPDREADPRPSPAPSPASGPRLLAAGADPDLGLDGLAAPDAPAGLATVVDPERYSGEWFAVAARKTSLWNRLCRSGTGVRYDWDPGSGSFTGANRCGLLVGGASSPITAFPARPDGRLLAVTTFGDTLDRPGYVIYALSDRDVPVRSSVDVAEPDRTGYDWAVISDRGLRDAWVLARDPADGARVLREVADVLPLLGLGTDQVRLEGHPDADYPAGERLDAWLADGER